MDGDDASNLLTEFASRFHVDLTGFLFSRHFGPEAGWIPFYALYCLFTGRGRTEPVTVGQLAEAAEGGAWSYGRGERQFIWVLAIFFIAVIASSLLPTPGSWSDVRSQWFPPAAMALTTLCSLIWSLQIYRRGGFAMRIQAFILWFVFAVVLVAAICSLVESFTFLQEVRRNHG